MINKLCLGLRAKYGVVLTSNLDFRPSVLCADGKTRTCTIPEMMRRQAPCIGNFVLIGLREGQDYKGDVLERYNKDQVKELENQEEFINLLKLMKKKKIEGENK